MHSPDSQEQDFSINKLLNSKTNLMNVPFFKKIYDQLYYRYEVMNTKRMSLNQFYNTFMIIQKAFANSPILDHNQFYGEWIRKKFGNDSFMILNYTANLYYCYVKYFYEKVEGKVIEKIISVATANKQPLQFYLKCYRVAIKLFGLNSLNGCYLSESDFLAYINHQFNDKTNQYGHKIWKILQNDLDLLQDTRSMGLDSTGLVNDLQQYFTDTNKISQSYILEYIFDSYLSINKRMINDLSRKSARSHSNLNRNNTSRQSPKPMPNFDFRDSTLQSYDHRNTLSTEQSRFNSKSPKRADSQDYQTNNTNLFNQKQNSLTAKKFLQVTKALKKKKQQVCMLSIIMQHMEELRSSVMNKIEECLYDFENLKRSHDITSYHSYQNILDQSKGNNIINTNSGYNYFSENFEKNSQADKENLHYRESLKRSEIENQKKLRIIWEKLTKNYDDQYYYIKKNSEPFKEIFNSIKKKYPSVINSKIGTKLLEYDKALKTLRVQINNKIIPDTSLFLRNTRTATVDETTDERCDDCGGMKDGQDNLNQSEPEDDINPNIDIYGKNLSFDRKIDRPDSQKAMHKISESFGEEESSEVEIKYVEKEVSFYSYIF